jgi:hypothetical protein
MRPETVSKVSNICFYFWDMLESAKCETLSIKSSYYFPFLGEI